MLRSALIWVLTAAPLAAEDMVDRVQAAYADWVVAQNTSGVIAVGTNGALGWEIFPAAGRGELASVSKSVTAICALALVEEGRLDWSDTVEQRLGEGPAVTLAQLVTHSSGLVRDGTQAAMPVWLDRPTSPAGHNARVVFDLIVARGAPQGERGRYAYNNENYALVALMIEAATGQGYVEACWPRLELDDGIGVSARTAAFGPWGGLEARPEAYLAFLHRHFGPESPVGQDPLAFPHVDIGGGAYYGLGMVFRPFRDGFNFWHFGAQCFPGRLEAGSYIVMWEGKVSALAVYDACVDWDTMISLDHALSTSVYRGVP